MCPSPVPEHIISEIGRLRGIGGTVDSITESINKDFEHPKGGSVRFARNTVHNYMKKYDSMTAEDRLLDQPVDWNAIEENLGVPWDAVAFLFQVWFLHIQRLPMGREVLWWWKIHRAAPDAPVKIVKAVSEIFASVERYEGTTGEATDWMPDWAFLAFQPWSSRERSREYERMVKLEQIPRGHFRISEVGDNVTLENSFDGDRIIRSTLVDLFGGE